MTEEGFPFSWTDWRTASEEGRTAELLAALPRERWGKRDKRDKTLLHYACHAVNSAGLETAVTLLNSKLLDVNSRDVYGLTAAHTAVISGRWRVLELLCAAGADLRTIEKNRDCAPIDDAISDMDHDDTARMLVANGVRLDSVHKRRRLFITSKLEAFEHSVLRCRTLAVAVMRVKKACNLCRWSDFLLKEIAIAIWATRHASE